MSANIEQLVEQISKLSLIETSSLVKALEEKLGVSAAAPVAVAAAAPVAVAAEKTEFDVMLVTIGDSKINVIKEVRALTTLGLVEAKSLVDSAPSLILKGAKKTDAEEAKKKLEAAGAKVELK